MQQENNIEGPAQPADVFADVSNSNSALESSQGQSKEPLDTVNIDSLNAEPVSVKAGIHTRSYPKTFRAKVYKKNHVRTPFFARTDAGHVTAQL